MRTTSSLLIAFFTIFTACGPVITQDPIQSPPHALTVRSPDSVELFTAGAPARAHVDVSVLHAENGDSASRIAKLRESAAAMGCDGLALANTDAGWAATCIVYK